MRAVLAHRDFRLLWCGQAASLLGDHLVTVALALFVIDLTGSATDLGLVLAAYFGPFVLLLAFGGVWADRLPRHRVMIVADVTRAVLHGVLAVLILTGTCEIWHLIVIEVLFGSAAAFFQPAYTGLVPQTVPEGDIQRANALSGLSSNVAEFAGPALATVLVLSAGAGVAFAVDAATFVVSAVLLAFVRPRPRGEQRTEVTTIWADLVAGFDEVRSRVWVWATIAVFTFVVLVVMAPWFTLAPVIARDVYGSTAIYGVVTAAFGAGTIAGTIWGVRWRPERPLRAAFIWLLPWPLAAGLYALGLPLGVVVVAQVLGGLGIGLFGVWWDTALAERIPPDKLSRVSAFDWMGSLGLLPLGYVLAGPLGEALGEDRVLAVGALLALIASAAALLVRDIRELGPAGPAPRIADVHRT